MLLPKLHGEEWDLKRHALGMANGLARVGGYDESARRSPTRRKIEIYR
jgi:hypothetical protein